jgi:hypothetical protein
MSDTLRTGASASPVSTDVIHLEKVRKSQAAAVGQGVENT